MSKNNYYHIFKSWLGSWPKIKPSLRVGLTVYLDQRKGKNGYYYSLKTQLGDWNETRPEMVNIRIKVVIIIILKLDLEVKTEQGLRGSI